MGRDSLCKKRRPLVGSKVRTQVLIFKAVLGVLLSCFLVEKVSKPVLSEIRFDGEMGPVEKHQMGVPPLQEGGSA